MLPVPRRLNRQKRQHESLHLVRGLVLIHGFLDTPRTWDRIRPALERQHDVLAPRLAGHAGAPPLPDELTATTLADAVGEQMDAAGLTSAHLVGNSLGGHIALQLAARGRALSVVALAPAGGWPPGDRHPSEVFEMQRALARQARALAPFAPDDEQADQLIAIANSSGAERLIDFAVTADWSLDAERITCPVRIVWGTADPLLPWPSAAARYREEWLPQADWIELDGVGHYPQIDAPLETAQLILGVTASRSP